MSSPQLMYGRLVHPTATAVQLSQGECAAGHQDGPYLEPSSKTNTIEMVQAILQHEVENFEQWLAAFKSGEDHRAQHGVRITGVFRGHDNPNHVTVMSEADSAAAYDSLFADPALAASMKEAGVKNRPEMHKMTAVL
jgi:hypothetical protein